MSRKQIIVTSEAYKLIREDVQRWLKNQVIFFAPALIVFLVAIQQGQDVNTAINAVYVWFLGALIDITRKFISTNSYEK